MRSNQNGLYEFEFRLKICSDTNKQNQTRQLSQFHKAKTCWTESPKDYLLHRPYLIKNDNNHLGTYS